MKRQTMVTWRGKQFPAKNEKGWNFLRVNSGGDAEYACSHGVGHGGMHGCDGCCYDTPLELGDQETGSAGAKEIQRESERADDERKIEVEMSDEFDLICGCVGSSSEQIIIRYMQGCKIHHYPSAYKELVCGCEVDRTSNIIKFAVKGCLLHEDSETAKGKARARNTGY